MKNTSNSWELVHHLIDAYGQLFNFFKLGFWVNCQHLSCFDGSFKFYEPFTQATGLRICHHFQQKIMFTGIIFIGFADG